METKKELNEVKLYELNASSGTIVARNLIEEYSIFDIAVLFS
jgi:hypothetical protein